MLSFLFFLRESQSPSIMAKFLLMAFVCVTGVSFALAADRKLLVTKIAVIICFFVDYLLVEKNWSKVHTCAFTFKWICVNTNLLGQQSFLLTTSPLPTMSTM